MTKLSYITLVVSDVVPVRDWYVEDMGMDVRWESPEFVLLMSDTANLGLHRGTPLQEPAKVQLHFEVSDVDAEYERLQAQGLTFRQTPETMPWGYRTAYLADPAGHTVEIYTPTV